MGRLLVPRQNHLSNASDSNNTYVEKAIKAAKCHGVPLNTVSAHIPISEVVSEVIANLPDKNASFVYIYDLAAVRHRLSQFNQALPGVTPYYAVKCNPDPVVLCFMAQLGMSFDCASRHEIQLVKSALHFAGQGHALKDRIIYANPFKSAEDLAFASHLDCPYMTFDTIDELVKISKCFPAAQLLLRISTEDSDSTCPLSSKFGADIHEVPPMLQHIEKLNLNLVGVSFHVGSGCTAASSYTLALHSAKLVFQLAMESGLKLSILDIGGGFPGNDCKAPVTFNQIAEVVRDQVPRLFDRDVRVIAEPGNYFAMSMCTFSAQVVLTDAKEDIDEYYIADGIFGSFRDSRVLNAEFVFEAVPKAGNPVREQGLCHIYGPSRNEIDVISRYVRLPKLNKGDWVYSQNMGAYTICFLPEASSKECKRTYIYSTG